MKIGFEKYHGTGNDFIVIDNYHHWFPLDDKKLVMRLCDRNFGIGSDGLMLVSPSREADFEMIFFNPDASKSLCGNGSRCSVHFAHKLGLAKREGTLLTTDGLHAYRMNEDDTISIRMNDVEEFKLNDGNWFINTGSPHLMVLKGDIGKTDLLQEGRAFRYSEEYREMGGTNVNFVEANEDGSFKIRTYERGVENETLSCGTGVTAAALSMALEGRARTQASFQTKGGLLTVEFERRDNTFTEIWLTGPAQHVFSGEIDA
jgi:diaminopimelate epimerase